MSRARSANSYAATLRVRRGGRTANVGEPIPQNLNQLIERVAGTSIKELDQLISELTVVRDYLKAEGERVQREIANYAQVSQAAMSSAKIILDSMGQWKSTVSPQARRPAPPNGAEHKAQSERRRRFRRLYFLPAAHSGGKKGPFRCWSP